MRILLLLFVCSNLLTAQTITRIGVGTGDCGTMTDPCPTALCTPTSPDESTLTISIPSGSRINYTFNQANGCDPSMDYILESGENVTATHRGITTTLFSGDGTTSAFGVGCFFNNEPFAVDLSITINSDRRDEAVVFKHTIEADDNGCTLLPVELKSFKVAQKNNTNLVVWETTSEVNNSHFVLEHSLDGRSYNQLSMIKGQVNSTLLNSYSFSHEDVNSGTHYYQLVQYDLDGNSKIYGPISAVNTNKDVRFFPSLVDDVIHFHGEFENEPFTIYSTSGKLILSGTMDSNIDVSQIPNGLYYIRYGNKVETLYKL